MKNSDYPYSFQVSDIASIRQQSYYLLAIKLEFFLIVLTALFAGFILLKNPQIGKACSISMASAIGLAFLIKIILKALKWDQNWFDTRAIAESIKMITWHYIMAVEPYPSTLSQEDVDKKFVTNVDEILEARPNVRSIITSSAPYCNNQISDQMRKIRKLNITERIKIYANQRIKDQRTWYKTKTIYNKKRERFWFIAILVCEGLAIIWGVVGYITYNINSYFAPVGVFTTLTGNMYAWTEIKKYREVSQSYAIAELELASIEALGIHVKDEESLFKYVANTENTISREHSMWLAKRI